MNKTELRYSRLLFLSNNLKEKEYVPYWHYTMRRSDAGGKVAGALPWPDLRDWRTIGYLAGIMQQENRCPHTGDLPPIHLHPTVPGRELARQLLVKWGLLDCTES